MSWVWAAARCTGTSHFRENSPCQDAVRCIAVGPDKETLVAIVSDGAGSALYGGSGSALVARAFSECARDHFKSSSQPPSDDDVWNWIDLIRDRLARAAAFRTADRRQFAATLVAAIIAPNEAMFVHIGDGAAVCRVGEDWNAPSWPSHGEYASTTYFVTDEPAPQVKITRVNVRVDAVAVFSDGLERLALQFSTRTPHAPFFNNNFKLIWASQHQGLDVKLSEALASYLGSTAINERTDDDKSLILAARK